MSQPRLPGLARRHLFGLAAGSGFTSLLSGCGVPGRGPAVPTGKAVQATVLGVPNERVFPAVSVKPLEAEFIAAVRRQRQTLGLTPWASMPQVQLLAVSGGGENGAFGAGLLCGWSAQG